MEQNNIQCQKCGSDNISFQVVENASIGMNKTTYYKKRKSILYMLLISWWIWIFRWLWGLIKACLTGGLSLFFKKKKKTGYSKTVNANKVINKTVAVCQSCGHTWNV